MARDVATVKERAAPVPPVPEDLTPSQRARRQRIVVAGLQLLQEHPYDRIQMRDVAEHADVALGTVYRYFVSKEHLFAAVLVEWGDQLTAHVRKRPLRAAAAHERLTELMMRVLSAFERWPEVYTVVALMDSTADPFARAQYASFASGEASTVAGVLGDFAPATATLIVRIANAMLNAVLRSWVNGTITMAEARRQLAGTIDLIFSAPPAPVLSEPPPG
jgi:AcrR family transcriptional regulator